MGQVESPTGTGKSLTLLTSTLTWLQQNQKRADEEAEKALRGRLQADDPDGEPVTRRFEINLGLRKADDNRPAMGD